MPSIYTPHVQVVTDERFTGRKRQPTTHELALIESYREAYMKAFSSAPAGVHWLDELKAFVLLRREGGLPGDESAQQGRIERQ